MKKVLLHALGIMICLFTACHKDRQLKKSYLLSQEIINDTADGAPLDTTNFIYDNENRLTIVKAGLASGKISFTMAYDAAGRVTVAKKLNSNGSLVKEYDYFYSPNTGFILHVPGQVIDTVVFTFNGQKQITRAQTLHKGYQLFTYDSRGNISSLKSYYADGSNDVADENYYGYDTKNSYFSQVAPNNLFLMYSLYSDASTLINNVITKNADKYSYTYNNEGFPTEAMAQVVGHSLTPIYYNYIVK